MRCLSKEVDNYQMENQVAKNEICKSSLRSQILQIRGKFVNNSKNEMQ